MCQKCKTYANKNNILEYFGAVTIFANYVKIAKRCVSVGRNGDSYQNELRKWYPNLKIKLVNDSLRIQLNWDEEPSIKYVCMVGEQVSEAKSSMKSTFSIFTKHRGCQKIWKFVHTYIMDGTINNSFQTVPK